MYINHISRTMTKHAVCHQMFPNIHLFLTGQMQIFGWWHTLLLIRNRIRRSYFLLTFLLTGTHHHIYPMSILCIHLTGVHSFLKNFVITQYVKLEILKHRGVVEGYGSSHPFAFYELASRFKHLKKNQSLKSLNFLPQLDSHIHWWFLNCVHHWASHLIRFSHSHKWLHILQDLVFLDPLKTS